MTKKKVVWTIIAIAAAAGIGLFLLLRAHRLRMIAERQLVPIEGAVIQYDADTKNELPVADVVITASDGVRSATTRSDAAGYFKLVLQKRVLSEQPITVTFRNPRYEPLDLTVQTGRLGTKPQLYIAAMVPIVQKTTTGSNHPLIQVSNIRVRYTLNSRNQTNVGDRCQDLPGGQPGRCALRSSVSLFARWQMESSLYDLAARCRGGQ